MGRIMRDLEVFFKQKLKAVIFFVVRFLDLLIPKKQDLWVFAIGRQKYWVGNLRAVFEVAKRDPEMQSVIVNQGAIPCTEIKELYGISVRVVPTITLSGLWTLLRARVIFMDYGFQDMFWPVRARGHLFVNLWHSMLLKGIAFMQPGADEERWKNAFKYDAMLSSSKIERLAMMSCFNLLPSKVWVTGLPRNNWLIQETTNLPPDLQMLELRLMKMVGNRRLVLYAPTFRDKHSGLYLFSESELDALVKLLNEENAVLGIRSHLHQDDRPSYLSHPEFLDLSYLVCPEPQILLRITDVLITDYSGIWLDFLLLKTRPIIGFVYDWDDYMKERGLLYDYRIIFPGPLVQNYADFKIALEVALEKGIPMDMQPRYQTALDTFHTYQKGDAAKRVIETVKEAII